MEDGVMTPLEEAQGRLTRVYLVTTRHLSLKTWKVMARSEKEAIDKVEDSADDVEFMGENHNPYWFFDQTPEVVNCEMFETPEV